MMRMPALRAVLVSAAICSAVLAPVAGAATPGQLSVSVSPPSITLPGGQATTLSVRNTGATAAWINVSTGNFDITPNGTVRVDPKLTPGRSARSWLKISPTRLRLAAGATAQVTVASKPSRIAAPGDHQALVLFTTAGSGGAAVTVKARVGVSVLVRVGGPLRRALGIAKPTFAKRKARRFVKVRLTNNGNVAERLLPRNLLVTVRVGRRKVVKRGVRTTILPGTHRVLWFAVPKGMKGRARVSVNFRPQNGAAAGVGVPRARRITKTFRVNLGK